MDTTSTNSLASARMAPARLAPIALSVLRIVAGYMFILHGAAKLFGVPHQAMFDHLDLMSLEGVAAVLEAVGGVAMVLGLLVRPVAFVLSGEMAFAYFMAHAPRGNALIPLTNGGDAAVLFCFVFLFIAAAGGGAWSLDAVLASAAERRAANQPGGVTLAR